VPDYPTNVPPAGWYTDPANSAQERWWGGVEWTHDVRPLAGPTPAVVLTPEPALANVPGGGVNPFAAIDAQERQGAGMFADSYSAAPSNPFSSSGAGQDAFGQTADPYSFRSGAQQGSFSTTPSWNSSGQRNALRSIPSNGQATAGLVFSLLGFSVLGITFSLIGLRKARTFEAEGEVPLGRKRSRWGIALGILAFVVSLSLTAIYLLGFQYALGVYLPQTAAVAEREGVPTSDVVLDTNGLPLVYSRVEVEQEYYEAFEDEGLTVDLVSCPGQARMVIGGGFECSFTANGATHTLNVTWTSNRGDFTTAFDGVVQE